MPPRRASEFTEEELRRYSRQLALPEIGRDGQRKLKNAVVLIVGAGGLGSAASLYLAGAGVGRIGLVDSDVVDLANLHRQPLHGTADVGRRKLESAAETLRGINPDVRVETHEARLSAENAAGLLGPYDLVVDATDNFPARYVVGDACARLGKAEVYGSVLRFEGQASVFDARRGPCYRCLFPEPPPADLAPDGATAGILGPVPGLIGLIQATEVIKLVIGRGDPLIGRLLLYDALAMRFREMSIRKNPHCAVCGKKPARAVTPRSTVDSPSGR